MTEREKKRTRITGRESVREKDREKERHGRRMCHRIYERKQGTRSREATWWRERRPGERIDESDEEGRDEKERSRYAGGSSWRRERTRSWPSGERREDEGVERDSAVISEREEACGCDVRRPC